MPSVTKIIDECWLYLVQDLRRRNCKSDYIRGHTNKHNNLCNPTREDLCEQWERSHIIYLRVIHRRRLKVLSFEHVSKLRNTEDL